MGELIQANIRSAGMPPVSVELVVGNEIPLSGHRKHIIKLYDNLRPSLRACLSPQGLSKEHSEDQEVFLRLVRRIVIRGPDENPRAWVFRVANNLSMNYHSSEKCQARPNETETHTVLREHVDLAPDPEQTILLRQRLRCFAQAVAQLTPKQRHCLLLRAKGLRYREIAQAKGVNAQRIGKRIQRVTPLIVTGVARR